MDAQGDVDREEIIQDEFGLCELLAAIAFICCLLLGLILKMAENGEEAFLAFLVALICFSSIFLAGAVLLKGQLDLDFDDSERQTIVAPTKMRRRKTMKFKRLFANLTRSKMPVIYAADSNIEDESPTANRSNKNRPNSYAIGLGRPTANITPEEFALVTDKKDYVSRALIKPLTQRYGQEIANKLLSDAVNGLFNKSD